MKARIEWTQNTNPFGKPKQAEPKKQQQKRMQNILMMAGKHASMKHGKQ